MKEVVDLSLPSFSSSIKKNRTIIAMAADKKDKSQVHKVALKGSAKTVAEFVSSMGVIDWLWLLTGAV